MDARDDDSEDDRGGRHGLAHQRDCRSRQARTRGTAASEAWVRVHAPPRMAGAAGGGRLRFGRAQPRPRDSTEPPSALASGRRGQRIGELMTFASGTIPCAFPWPSEAIRDLPRGRPGSQFRTTVELSSTLNDREPPKAVNTFRTRRSRDRNIRDTPRLRSAPQPKGIAGYGPDNRHLAHGSCTGAPGIPVATRSDIRARPSHPNRRSGTERTSAGSTFGPILKSDEAPRRPESPGQAHFDPRGPRRRELASKSGRTSAPTSASPVA